MPSRVPGKTHSIAPPPHFAPRYNEAIMSQRVEAVYEQGVLRPLEPVSLEESQRVQLTIQTSLELVDPAVGGLLESIRAEVEAMKSIPTIDEVQRALSTIPGSLVEDFHAEREDRH